MSFFSKLSKATSSLMSSAASQHEASRQRVERQLSSSSDPKIKARMPEIKARSAEMAKSEHRIKSIASDLNNYATEREGNESNGLVRSQKKASRFPSTEHRPENSVDNQPVNINTAGLEALVMLPGIGPGLAKRILHNRYAQGSFKTVEDLKRVNGIGDTIYRGLKDMVVV